jgi:hypothetical protein
VGLANRTLVCLLFNSRDYGTTWNEILIIAAAIEAGDSKMLKDH